jgi:hypothetical protein
MPVAQLGRPAHLLMIMDNSAADLKDGGAVGH